MRIRPQRFRSAAVPLLLSFFSFFSFFSFLLFSLGCGKESTSPPRTSPGSIEGWVDGGTGPVPALVRATPIDPTAGSEISATADSSGHYLLSLPQGGYYLSVEYDSLRFYYSLSGVVQNGPGDSLLVGPDPVRADFPNGGLTIDLTAFPQMEGRTFLAQAEMGTGTERISSKPVSARITEGKAEFLFSWLPPGVYVIRMQAGSGEDFWLYDSADRANAVKIHLFHGRTVHQGVLMDSPALVRGRIRGSWQEMGAPVPRIAVFRSVSELWSQFEVGADGWFALESFVPRQLRFRVEIGGISRWWGGRSFDSATVAEMRPGEEIILPDYEEGGILCRLSDASMLPPEKASIELTDESGNPVTPSDLQWISPGPVRLANLLPGVYRLSVSPPADQADWCAQWFDGGHSASEATPIRIDQPTQVVNVDVHLHREGTIAGTGLFFPADLPVQAVLAPAGDPAGQSQVPCDASTGAFSFSCVPPGDYKIGVIGVRGTQVTWVPGTENWESARVFPLGHGGEVSGIEIRLPS